MVLTLRAFFVRDLIAALSYKTAFVLQMSGVFFGVVLLYFVSETFGQATSSALAAYGGNYFAFVFIGIAFLDYLAVSMYSFGSGIREGQVMGTLEVMLLSKTRLPLLLLGTSLWPYTFCTLRSLVYLGLGVLVFGLDVGQANVASAAVVFGLSVVCFASFGILAAAFIVVFKKGDSVFSLFAGSSALLGGLLYPISVMPDWLSSISAAIPLTYALEGMRQAVLQGAGLSSVLGDVIALGAFTGLFLPLGFFSFRWAIRRAKVTGTLTHY